jgi:hypothetical protein
MGEARVGNDGEGIESRRFHFFIDRIRMLFTECVLGKFLVRV